MNVNITPKELQLIQFAHYLNTHPAIMALFAAVAVWTIVWKGIALWKAARNGHTAWYVVLLLVNTVGLLEIIYFFLVGNKKNQE